MSSVKNVFIFGTSALGVELWTQMEEELSPYHLSFHIEFNDQSLELLTSSDLVVVVADEEDHVLQYRMATTIQGYNSKVSITTWDIKQGAEILRFIVDCFLVDGFLQKHQPSPPQEPESQTPKLKIDVSESVLQMPQIYQKLVFNQDVLDIEASNLALKTEGFYITSYVDGVEGKLGLIVRPLNPE